MSEETIRQYEETMMNIFLLHVKVDKVTVDSWSFWADEVEKNMWEGNFYSTFRGLRDHFQRAGW